MLSKQVGVSYETGGELVAMAPEEPDPPRRRPGGVPGCVRGMRTRRARLVLRLGTSERNGESALATGCAGTDVLDPAERARWIDRATARHQRCGKGLG